MQWSSSLAQTSGARSGGRGPEGTVWSWEPRKSGLEGRAGPGRSGRDSDAAAAAPTALCTGSKPNAIAEARNLGFCSHAQPPTPPSKIPCQTPLRPASHLRISWLSSRRSVPESIKMAVRMDLDQLASGMTSTLSLGVHPRLSSKRHQDLAVQGPDRIQPTPRRVPVCSHTEY